MSRAIRIHRTGGPEVLEWEEIDVPPPAAGEVRVRHTAIGLNFIDTYHRSGLYPLPALPAILGREAAGVVVETGPGVTDFKPGDRVAHVLAVGAYVEEANVPADRLVRIPEPVSDRQAAAMMLKGLTAQYLLRRTCEVGPDDTILVHAAAGGVGLILCQWAKALGATVIGTVGSREKAELVRAHGCEHPVLYREESFRDRVREITDGAGVSVVYDSVGAETFEASLDCLRRRGLLVSFGQSSGPIAPFQPGILAAKGSLYLTRPTLVHYVAAREDLLANAAELFEITGRGAVRIEIGQHYPLSETRRAHEDLEGRRTTGSTVLLP